jgi:hypothetical protein
MKKPRKRTPKQKFDFYWRLMAVTELSLPAKVVATALLLKFHNEKTGRCNPGAGSIAKTIGISRRMVFYGILELKNAGWISVESIKGGGSKCSNRYSFDFERVQKSAPPNSAQDVPSNSAQDVLVRKTTPNGTRVAHEPLRTTRAPRGGCVGETPNQRAPDGALEREEDRNSGAGAADFKVLFKIWDDAKLDGTDEDMALKAFNRVVDKGAEPHLIIEGAQQWVDAMEPRYLPALERWLAKRAWRKDPPARRRSRSPVDVAFELAEQGHGGWRK